MLGATWYIEESENLSDWAPASSVAWQELAEIDNTVQYRARLDVGAGDRFFRLAMSQTEAAFTAPLSSADSIVGLAQANAPAVGYYPDENVNYVGSSGSSGSATRTDRNVVLGFALPTLPEGMTIAGANLHFEIKANLLGNENPAMDVYVLNTANPDATGSAFFFQGAEDNSADVAQVGQIYLDDGGSEMTHPDDAQDMRFVMSGEALEILKSIYAGSHIPQQSEVFFRFSLSTADSISQLRRYRVDFASNDSWLELIAAENR